MNRTAALHYASIASLIALIILCLAWELWLAPLRPGGSSLVFKVLPLLLPLAASCAANATPTSGPRC